MLPKILLSLSLLFHTLATIALMGFYFTLGMIYLPVMKQQLAPAETKKVVIGAFNAFRIRIYLSLIIFAVTGIHLTWVNRNFSGPGNFGNPWSMLMLVKHLFVVAAVAGAIAVIRQVSMLAKSGNPEADESVMKRITSGTTMMIAVCIIVLLLTAAAQGFSL
jgi:uncharacterized membrane protein